LKYQLNNLFDQIHFDQAFFLIGFHFDSSSLKIEKEIGNLC